MRYFAYMLGVCLLAGCQHGPPPEPPVPPPAEDLSHYTVPELVQPETLPPTPERAKPRPATAAEKVYDYSPGTVYKVQVGLDADLDIILEPGEKVGTILGRDPKPLVQVEGEHQKKQRWDYKEGGDGVGPEARPHVFVGVTEADATLGLTITTSRRVYYLTCQSVKTSPIRAVRWHYADNPSPQDTEESAAPRLLPHPDEPKLYHVGYSMKASHPHIPWSPRYLADDGKKLYIVYPEVTLFGTVPLIRALGVNGPQVLNTRQFLNTVIIDNFAQAPRFELRVGTGETAQTITITREQLRTIECPNHPECPRFPAAANHPRRALR